MTLSTKQANAKIEKVSNNTYSIVNKYNGYNHPLWVRNNVTNDTEYIVYHTLMMRIRGRNLRLTNGKEMRAYKRNYYYKHRSNKYYKRHILRINNHAQIGEMTSGDYYFPSVIKNRVHYLKLQNIINYLGISIATLRSKIKNIFDYDNLFSVTNRADMDDKIKDVLFNTDKQPYVGVSDAKSIYFAIKAIMKKSRIIFDRNHARTLLKSLIDKYRNEITGVTDLTDELAKHNARVERLSQEHLKQSRIEKNQSNLGSKISGKLKQLEAFKAKIESDAKDEVAKIRLNAKKKAEKADEKIKHVSNLNDRLQNIYRQILDLDA